MRPLAFLCRFVFFFFSLLLCGATAAEIPQTDTLRKIRNSGVVSLSYQLSSIPFSYLDEHQQPTGYTKEICDRVVETLKTELGMPTLKAAWYPVPATERVSQLQKGYIDLECGPTSNTAKRREEADFSLTYFVSGIRLLARKERHFRSLDDLKGQTLVVAQGTTAAELPLRARYLDRRQIKLLEARTHDYAFMLITNGKAAAYAIDDVLLAGLLNHVFNPDQYEIFGDPLSSEYYAIMTRKGDGLKAVVDRTLRKLMASGELAQMYERWFMRPLFADGHSLNLPMSSELKARIAHPADETEADKAH
ncbi:MAG: amino acid ABC transporter substrate-binding protein [Zoogloeaceae bacterium]|nr:amino acid ABC transporter substrate-binding protein [Zoogloeaceae bacterium]